MTNDELKNQVPSEILPDYLGGTAKLNHKSWLIECNKLVTNKASTCNNYYFNSFRPSQNGETTVTNSTSAVAGASTSTTGASSTCSSASNIDYCSLVNAQSNELNVNRKRGSTDFIDLEDKKNVKKQISAIHENAVNGNYIVEKIEPLPFQNL